jgi:hypothetical protein
VDVTPVDSGVTLAHLLERVTEENRHGEQEVEPVDAREAREGETSFARVRQTTRETTVYVFLDPDGTQGFGLYLLVLHPTGVLYGNQCAGYLVEERRAEGFLIPLGGPDAARPLADWFWTTFKGHSYDQPATDWNAERIEELRALVAAVYCWHTSEDGADEPYPLSLDQDRLDECTEAWVPVESPYGPGILLFENSD